MAFTFPARVRLRLRRDFERVYRTGVRVQDGLVKLWVARGGSPESRLGLSVGRRYGAAPERNRFKRLIREAFRLTRVELPTGLDIICSPSGRDEPTLEQALASVRELTRRAAGRLEANAGRTDSDSDRVSRGGAQHGRAGGG